MMNKVSIASAIIAASVMASTNLPDGGYEWVSSTEECGAELYELYSLNSDLLDAHHADGINVERAYVTNCWK